MDPLQRKFLEVVYEAFENARVPWAHFSGSSTGVYEGITILITVLCNHETWLGSLCNYGKFSINSSNRVNFVFNLRGPRYLVPSFRFYVITFYIK